MAEQESQVSKPPPPGPGARLAEWWRARRPWRWVAGVFHIPTIAFFAIGAVLLHQIGAISLPFAPFTTRGAIHVDSPEVYTRERLVNDRYEQDHWLRAQLEALDGTRNLLTASLVQSFSGGVGAPAAPGPDQQPPAAPPPDGGGAGLLPFDQEFRIRSAIRDSIRQLVLENMLDDRHDLTGNSVYGLKFDTTLIPGRNTRQRAFVRVVATAPPPMEVSEEPGAEYDQWIDDNAATLPYEIWLYYDEGPEFHRNPASDLHRPFVLYQRWLQSLQNRLNDHIATLHRAGFAERNCEELGPRGAFDLATRKAIELVLGIDAQRYDLTEPDQTGFAKPITLPAPWSGVISVQRRSLIVDGEDEESCRARPWFQVQSVTDSVYIFDGDMPDWAARRLFLYEALETPKVSLAVPINPDQPWRSMDEFVAVLPKFQVDGDLIAAARHGERVRSQDLCLEHSDTGECTGGFETADLLVIPSGLFNFIQKIKQIDAYAYAIFPKNDAVGILADTSVETSAELPEITQGWLKFLRRMRETQAHSVLVGFSRAGRKEGEVEFGWVISGRGLQEPAQKAQMSLVSVPAWTTRLKLEITTGWLDRNSAESGPKATHTQEVNLPADYEALDSILFKGSEGRRPKILDDFMTSGLTVTACAPARILIPGSRLWRSAEVTLDAQLADKITVLPNMEGIIADFDEVAIPNPLPGRVRRGGPLRLFGSEVEAQLRVWTSEGMDMAETPVAIRLPADGSGACVDGSAAGGE